MDINTAIECFSRDIPELFEDVDLIQMPIFSMICPKCNGEKEDCEICLGEKVI